MILWPSATLLHSFLAATAQIGLWHWKAGKHDHRQHIHADGVKEWLLQSGLDEAEVAIKTAEQNDLNQPENQDLLPTRWRHARPN